MSDQSSAATPIPLQVLARFWLPGLLLLVVVVYAAYWFKNAFHDRGYAPEQYIAFSHEKHAGEMKIDCTFCHFNALRGKHAGVPPMSVCLGCHRNVEVKDPVDQAEIAKLLKVADDGTYTDADGVIHDGGVVHWARVHRLPDHVYFNHQWHQRAGVACQTCHGPVQEMGRVRQFATLTMSWCLECHRKNNYVGGPGYDAKDPSTLAVGAPGYALDRAREQPDPVVEFAQRQTRGAPAPAIDTEAKHRTPVADAAPAQQTQITVAAQTAALLADHPEWKDLPAWRLAALPAPEGGVPQLPESHRPYYQSRADFMNAPTQCSTCHQ